MPPPSKQNRKLEVQNTLHHVVTYVRHFEYCPCILLLLDRYQWMLLRSYSCLYNFIKWLMHESEERLYWSVQHQNHLTYKICANNNALNENKSTIGRHFHHCYCCCYFLTILTNKCLINQQCVYLPIQEVRVFVYIDKWTIYKL